MTRSYTHYPHVFSNFPIFLFFIKCRRFIVAVCFSFSIIISNLLELRDFHDISTSQHLLNSVYVGNTGEPSVCFVPWLFCRLLWICNFVFTLQQILHQFYFYLLRLLFDSTLHYIYLIVFVPHINKCVSLHRRI